jgi:hypothetical protein
MTTPPRSATHLNPYSADGRAMTEGAAVAAGADPSHNSDLGTPGGPGNRWTWDNTGWSPVLTRDDYGNTPDPTRVEELPRHDRRANLRNPWAWWERLDRETAERESVTVQDANGWTEQKGERQRAPHPLWVPPPEPRPTTAMSPRTYYFERPFGKEIASRLTGAHISLADNRRAYDIYTMAPVPRLRNTYRVEPGPWDTDIVDEAPSTTDWRPDERLEQPPITSSVTTRSFRLG